MNPRKNSLLIMFFSMILLNDIVLRFWLSGQAEPLLFLTCRDKGG
jgi:hypothetical protein